MLPFHISISLMATSSFLLASASERLLGHGHRRAHEPLSHLMLAPAGICLPSGVREEVAVQVTAVPSAAASGRRRAMQVAAEAEPGYTADEKVRTLSLIELPQSSAASMDGWIDVVAESCSSSHEINELLPCLIPSLAPPLFLHPGSDGFASCIGTEGRRLSPP